MKTIEKNHGDTGEVYTVVVIDDDQVDNLLHEYERSGKKKLYRKVPKESNQQKIANLQLQLDNAIQRIEALEKANNEFNDY
ncbi:hypothetical protein IBB73_11580 [Listeria seeligeri]|uniref:hypothetical protein n=1 Tax=Listeria seeligeri TaxID=1640 RepID=UPI001888DB48|nr:hypothetical protein [Listeria seeligeri]MBF2656411.1 hypothetical protein [Listeria seeligeri]